LLLGLNGFLLELGYLTPPVGLNLFLAASRLDRPLLEVARGPRCRCSPWASS
jgi:TRAP-type C4-dicarboxylate transport system permease large subunit